MPTPSPTAATSPAAPRTPPLQVTGLLLAALVAASLVNALIAALALAAGASDDFMPLQPGAYIVFTIAGVLIGAGGWAVIRRRAGAQKLLRTLVPVVVIVSFIPDLAMLVSDYQPGADVTGVVALLLMHVAVAAIAVPSYQRALPLPSAEFDDREERR
ncbi:DUF6069 family protein [Streptomyces sp. NWU339]|uniref:DUF6069 family protein n=1 Tax=Streptomyces sp. NWU339 TaxID=2185284 RepID=UPI00215AB334|nr:DUF6069 family protein [Streptomyces sp. NWU339]